MRALMWSIKVVAACVIVETTNPSLAQQATSVSQPVMPLPQADPCLTRPCFKPSNSPVGADLPAPPPKDLTLQYPGEKPLSDVDMAAVAGAADKVIKAGMPAIEEVGGKALGAVAEGSGAALAGFKAGVDVVGAVDKGYSEGGVPGALANVSKVGVTNLVEAGAFDVTTALALPLGPLAPCIGVLVSCVAGAVTESILEKPLSPPSDYGFECAKTGSCAGGNSASGNSPAPVLSEDDISQAVNAAVDATVAATDKQFDVTLTAAEIAQTKSGASMASEDQLSSSDATLTALNAMQNLQNILNAVPGHTSHSNSRQDCDLWAKCWTINKESPQCKIYVASMGPAYKPISCPGM
jgi:hypothetical protein